MTIGGTVSRSEARPRGQRCYGEEFLEEASRQKKDRRVALRVWLKVIQTVKKNPNCTEDAACADYATLGQLELLLLDGDALKQFTSSQRKLFEDVAGAFTRVLEV